MALKEEFEILRGEPIEVFDGDPMDIPCIETSDAEELCKHPVVSVHMVTYNHEPYIRQAIEGVIMQKTDFEFELVIGEDCSQDKTREICFEYQRKYPDKIRVLWWHENVSKLGGNGRRNLARCRGEFIAFCEGDDYWIDPLKLQKQVDAMRTYSSVSVAFSGGMLLVDDQASHCTWFDRWMRNGVVKGAAFSHAHMYGPITFMLTASALIRKSALKECRHLYEIFNWRMTLGDTTTWLGLSSIGDVWWDSCDMVVYRRHLGGATGGRQRLCVGRDAALVRMYFSNKVLGLSTHTSQFVCNIVECRLMHNLNMPFKDRLLILYHVIASTWRYLYFYHIATAIYIMMYLFGIKDEGPIAGCSLLGFTHKIHRIPHCIYYWLVRRIVQD